MGDNNNTFSGNFNVGAMSTGDHGTATSYGGPQQEPKAKPPTQKAATNVLFVLSNPRGTDTLRLNEEMRAINEALHQSQQRELIQSHTLHAATANDLRRALLKQPPYRIVHMAGHGTNEGFVLEDASGQAHMVSKEALAQNFYSYRQTLNCVVLNACYSLVSGQRIALGIPYVIAMSGPINDPAAIEFSRGFYDGIGAGMDIERAYHEGLNAVRYADLDHDFLAVLLWE